MFLLQLNLKKYFLKVPSINQKNYIMKNIVNLECVNLMASEALKSSFEWFISNNHKLGILIVTGKFTV